MANSSVRPKTALASLDFVIFSMPSPAPKQERHEELSDWTGDDFDSKAFSVDLVNRILASKRRRSTATKNLSVLQIRSLAEKTQ